MSSLPRRRLGVGAGSGEGEGPTRVRAREAHGESVGAAARGADEEVAVMSDYAESTSRGGREMPEA